MANTMSKFILSKYPDADMDRYRFQPGDFIPMPDGAVLVAVSSAVTYVTCYVYKRSLKYREYCEIKVPYSEIPRYMERPEYKYKPLEKLKWCVGEIVVNPEFNTTVLLYQEVSPQAFYGYVLECESEYYLHTGIYLTSPVYWYFK